MSIDKVSQEDWLVGAVAVLLVFDLLFLPWFDLNVSAGALAISITSTATGAPEGWLGVLALLAVLALIADLVIERLNPNMQLPSFAGSSAATRTILAWAAAGLLAFKLLLHLGSAGGLGFWGAVVLTAGLLYCSHRAQRLETARR